MECQEGLVGGDQVLAALERGARDPHDPLAAAADGLDDEIDGVVGKHAIDLCVRLLRRQLIAIAAENDRGLDGEVSAHFGRCPFYVLAEANGDTVTGSRIVSNPHFGQHQPGVMPRFVHELGANVIIAGGMGPRAIDMFHGFGIDVATGVVGKVGEVLGAYLRGQHRGVVPCAHDHPESCGGGGQHRGGGHG